VIKIMGQNIAKEKCVVCNNKFPRKDMAFLDGKWKCYLCLRKKK